MISVIFDMDGVIYRGDETCEASPDTVKSLQDMGIPVGFLTNNAGRTREDRVEVLAKHGIVTSVNCVMTSAVATSRHLIKLGYQGKRIYAVGGKGLYITMEEYGFDVDHEDDGDPCDFVVVGWDRQFSFPKILRAQWEILYNHAGFYATNVDPMFPAGGGRVMPGAGTMVAAIEVASDTSAEVIGKPETIALEYLIEDLDIPGNSNPRDCWMIGDRLTTDILCGKKFGATTVLVTTGITSREQAEAASDEMKPDFIIDALSGLLPLIESDS